MILSDVIEAVERQKMKLESNDFEVEREMLSDLPKLDNHALVVSGIRRCGKSTILKQFVNKIGEDFFFLNFEDVKFSQFSFQDYELLDIAIKKSGKKVLFFDEIQNAEKWELYVRQKLDEKYRVLITGSNSSLLSKELGTKLTGRHIQKELFPFSYSEFLKLKSLENNEDSFSQYLFNGGFPEYIKTGNSDIAAQLVSDILYKDIAIRYGIRNVKSLKQLFVYIASNVANFLSPSKLISVCQVKSPATVLEYISHLETSYLVCTVPTFSYSLKSQSLLPKKVYLTDNGIINIASLSFSKNLGALLENIVFIHFRRQENNEIYCFNDGTNECDFVINPNSAPICVQVCYEMTVDNKKREIDGLFAAMDFFKTGNGVIVTQKQRDVIIKNGKRAEVIPANEFLLQ